MKIGFLLIVLFILSACASSTKQADALLASPGSLSPTHEIQNVPFINQAAGQCGPASLAMAINSTGKLINVEELTPQVYTPKMKGSLQSDMISAARRNGFLAIPIEGLDSLLKEVSANHPVIVFENLALSWLPQWHYAVVFGYDLKQETILMHSGPEAFKIWDIRKFERSWKLGNYWGLVVLPPDQLAATANELSHATAAAGLQLVGKQKEAVTAYSEILKRWPQSLVSLIGMGNWAFERRDYKKAVSFLKTATRYHPQSAEAWHNLAIAEQAAKMNQSAYKSAQRALMLVAHDSKLQYEASLSSIKLSHNKQVLLDGIHVI
ncbi:MAG: PA2778 family cysteine peptidase [Bdellovibrionales bacterium]